MVDGQEEMPPVVACLLEHAPELFGAVAPQPTLTPVHAVPVLPLPAPVARAVPPPPLPPKDMRNDGGSPPSGLAKRRRTGEKENDLPALPEPVPAAVAVAAPTPTQMGMAPASAVPAAAAAVVVGGDVMPSSRLLAARQSLAQQEQAVQALQRQRMVRGGGVGQVRLAAMLTTGVGGRGMDAGPRPAAQGFGGGGR
jgi:hypothetical protein